jgi:hypothetical protein
MGVEIVHLRGIRAKMPIARKFRAKTPRNERKVDMNGEGKKKWNREWVRIDAN